jgi:site-specific DNA-methyltransferase (adenine-specific)
MAAYGRMRDLLNKPGGNYLQREHVDLKAQSETLWTEYEERRREIEYLRRPFHIKSRANSTDVWNFGTVPHSPGKHPCEKPQAMLRHMIEASSRPGDLILDAFAGSGSTLLAASHAGRRAVGIEKDERWCERAANRLSQGTLELEWTA